MASSDSTRRVLDHALRFLDRIQDPDPDRAELDDLWSHFHSACATCGRALVRGQREGRHALADPNGRRGAIGNRILICTFCMEKRRENGWWRSLLGRCTRDPAAHAEREARIAEWRRLHPIPDPPESSRIAACHERAEWALVNFADACDDLRVACRTYLDQHRSPSTGTACVSEAGHNVEGTAHDRPRPPSC